MHAPRDAHCLSPRARSVSHSELAPRSGASWWACWQPAERYLLHFRCATDATPRQHPRVLCSIQQCGPPRGLSSLRRPSSVSALRKAAHASTVMCHRGFRSIHMVLILNRNPLGLWYLAPLASLHDQFFLCALEFCCRVLQARVTMQANISRLQIPQAWTRRR